MDFYNGNVNCYNFVDVYSPYYVRPVRSKVNTKLQSQQTAFNKQIKQIETDKQRIVDEKTALERKAGVEVEKQKVRIMEAEKLRANVTKFGISTKLMKEHPALVSLLLETESMKNEECKYWFQLLPTMTPAQVQHLQDILQNERDQLNALDGKYATEVAKLNDQHHVKWKAVEALRKRKQSEEQERNDQKKKLKKKQN